MVARNQAFGGNSRPQARTATRASAPQTAPIAGEVMDQDQALTPFGGGVVESITRGEVDIQIATAKRYPRDVTTFLKKAETLATRDVETAESCYYTLKRKDRNEAGGYKKIQGPSIRLAEILVACWGHMRVGGTILGDDGRFVSLRGMAWDLEANSAFSVDVKRRITTREGHTYSDDMIGVTSNAGVSIAVRNAVLHVIPGAIWKAVYEKCLVVARGDAKTLADRRTRMLQFFEQQYKKKPADIFGYLGIRGEADFTLDHLEEMQGLRTALKDGETTIEEAFADVTAAPEPPNPVTLIATETGASAAVAAAIHAGFEKLGVTPPNRLVQLKKHQGKAGELLELLRTMTGDPLPVEEPPTNGQAQDRPAQPPQATVVGDEARERESQPSTSAAPAQASGAKPQPSSSSPGNAGFGF